MNFFLFFTLSKKNVIYQQDRSINLFFKALNKSKHENQFDYQVDIRKRLNISPSNLMFLFCYVSAVNQRVLY